jgi:alkylation response protein AidB-like acyl-CoA dehydrogenase
MIATIESMVEEAASSLLADTADQALVEAAERGEWPARLWAAVSESGFTTALDQGLDGLPAALAVAKAAGANPAPIPLTETIIARGLAHAAGLALPEGPATLAPPRTAEVALAKEGSSTRLRGTIEAVPFGRWAQHVAVACDGRLALVPAKGLAWKAAPVRSGKATSGEPLDTADIDVVLPAGAVGNCNIDADALGALVRSFQMAGAMRTVLALTVQYANDRVQFGRPIGKFQSLQHLIAEMAENAAAADTAAAMALAAWGSPRERMMLASAKIRCGEASGIVAAGAHQVHGAIGFTREHRLHHLTRRLWTWRDEFGHEADWAIELGRMALGKGAGAVWPLIADG